MRADGDLRVREDGDLISNPGELERRAIFMRIPSVFTTKVLSDKSEANH